MSRGGLYTDRPQRRNRRSFRLKGYDYAGAGAYFVTICVQNRACLFVPIVFALFRRAIKHRGITIHRAITRIAPTFVPTFARAGRCRGRLGGLSRRLNQLPHMNM